MLSRRKFTKRASALSALAAFPSITACAPPSEMKRSGFWMPEEAGELAVRHYNFNGWGDKQIHGNDGKIAVAVAERWTCLTMAWLESPAGWSPMARAR